MSESAQSPNWPLISGLRPQLRRHLRIYPQEYRGERWYLLHDQANGRNLRFNATAYDFIGRLDGDATVQEIWDLTVNRQDEDALTQDEVVVVLTQLFTLDAMRSGLPADAQELFGRFQHDRSLRRLRAFMNPLAVRIRLLDPDQLLNRMLPWVRPLFSRTGALLWLLITGFAALLALINFPLLTAAVNQDILAPANILSMMLIFVFIKLVHEYAHALAVKMWGGEVHEMGITLLVLAPVPYVDASAAWGFRDKYKRVLVGAVGILVELFLAALALFLWLAVEPGLIKDAALNAMLIGSVSTLLFNANPLLRFDGYYVLQDLIEIPNLYTRSGRYYLYLAQRYLFGLTQARSPVSAAGEGRWFAVYGLAAFFYRLFILVVIVLFLAEEYLFVGVALGSWAVVMQLILPTARGMRYLATAPVLAGRRSRAIATSLLLASCLCAVTLFQPVNLNTRAEGVVWVSDQAQVYAGAEGLVAQVLVASGTSVEAGTPLVRMHDPTLASRISKLDARRRELDIRSAAEYLEQRVRSAITKEEQATVVAELGLLREQASELLVHSQVAGVFVMPDERRLQGRYLRQGELIGYVTSPERLIVRTVVPQSDIGLLRRQVDQVEVRFAERLDKTVQARIVRETPAGSTALPSRALGAAGGGDIAVKMNDGGGITATEKVFQVDLGLPRDIEVTGLGERAYVRFDHGAEPLASQWLRSARQLLLSRLSL